MNSKKGSKLNARQLAVVRSLNQLWREQIINASADPPSVLYHYTTVEGFRGILNTRFLRACEYRKATDTYELQHAEQPILEAAVALSRSFGSRSASRTVLDHFVREFDRLRVRNLPNTPIYLVSLSTSCDDTALWSSRYGAFGTGLSVGFRRVKEHRADLLSRQVGAAFLPVVYDLTEAGREFDKYARRAAIRLESSESTRSGVVRTDCVGTLLAIAASVCSATKSPEFTFEKEWRVVVLPKQDYEPELIDGRYIKWALRADPGVLPALESVHVGSKCSETVESVRDFLQELGYGRPEQEPMPAIVRSDRMLPQSA